MSRNNVVIVEDDPGLRDALGKVLSASGHSVRAYPSAEALLAAEGADDAGCLVLDVRLPGLSGLALYRALVGRGHTTPVVFMTAFDDRTTKDEAERLGASAYLVKPFRGLRLVEAVSHALGHGATSMA